MPFAYLKVMFFFRKVSFDTVVEILLIALESR
jgi:hypothetical protein